MMQIRCQKCGWNFTLGRGAVNNIMQEIKDKNLKHYVVDCPKCRHGIKVQTKKFLRFHRPAPAEE